MLSGLPGGLEAQEGGELGSVADEPTALSLPCLPPATGIYRHNNLIFNNLNSK